MGIHGLRRPRLGEADRRRGGGQFFDYDARGAPSGPDDGTVAPWVVVASISVAPEIVIPTIREKVRILLRLAGMPAVASARG